MNYSQALEYLSSLIDKEKKTHVRYKTSLNDFKEHLKKFDNPQKKTKGFLVGGTKGKGSTANIIESICRNAHFSTGLFTSPHLISYRERIKLDGRPISKAKFASLIEEIANVSTGLSVFETLTTMAFLLFTRAKVDYSIFEVGLGGRLDATNVFNPYVSVITSISFDHTEILGTKLSGIAKEKAKILRREKINISAPQHKEVEEILRNEVDGNIEFVKNYKVISLDETGTFFQLGKEKFHTSLIGYVQALNASLAIIACRKMGIKLSSGKLNKILMNLKIPGRFQIVSRKPHIILDGAHNVASIKNLTKTIREIYNKKVLLVFSCLSDKDIKGMLREIKPIVGKIFPTEIPYSRKMPLEEIKTNVKKIGIKMADTTGSLTEDIKEALECASDEDIVLVTGSFYLVGEALKIIKD